MQQFFAGRESNNNEGGASFVSTNYILKHDAAKIWPVYALSGKTSVKPYPVFDDNGTPCPARLTSRFEQDGNIPAAEALTKEEIIEYEGEVLPPNFVSVPTVTWVGKEGVQFIDFCSDIMDYRTSDEQDADVAPATPYSVMCRTLMKLVPTEKYKGDGKECPPTLKRCRNVGKGVLSLRYPQQAILFRAALIRHKGKPMETKSSVDGILHKVTVMISQKSARTALRNAFFQKADPTRPISADNFPLSGMFNPAGTFITFSKSDPSNSQSDYLVTPDYDANVNNSIINFFNAQDEGSYYAEIRNALGAFQQTADMLNIMTVQEQIDMIIKQFPAAWVWFGLRDSRYADLIPEQVKVDAKKDPEWAERFGVTPAETVPMNNFQQPKIAASGSFPSGGFGGFKQQPPQQVIKEAEVTYKPASKPAVPDVLKKYGAF